MNTQTARHTSCKAGRTFVMQVSVRCRPAYAMAICELSYQERVFVERQAMAAMSDGLSVHATTGGVSMTRALVRKATVGEPLIFTSFQAEREGAWVALAPKFPGDISTVVVDPSDPLVIQGGSLLAYSEGLKPELRYGGVKGVLMQEGLLFIRVRGEGSAVLCSYGGIERIELQAGEAAVIDTGHLVAFSDSMRYSIGLLGSLATASLSGEGLVSRFEGPGTVLIQTRSEGQLRTWLLPERQG